MTPEKVLMVNYEYPPLGGGGGVFTRDLAEELASRLQVTVLTSAGPETGEGTKKNGVRVLRLPVIGRHARATATLSSLLSFFPSSLWHGSRLLRGERFDLVHSFFAVPSACSGLLLARRSRSPHVLSILGGDVYDPTKRLSPHRTPLLSCLVRQLMNRTDALVSLSRDIETRARQFYGIRRGIDVIPIGIPRPSIVPAERSTLGFEEDDTLLITIGRLITRKGLADLLEVLSRSRDRRVKLLIIGEGPLRKTLEEKAKALNLQGRVRFCGFVSDDEKWRLLGAADIYVSTARHEGFGIVFLEAMAAGLPIVCYDEGGQTDFLADGADAFLVPLGEQESFTKRVKRLVVDPGLRKRMADQAKLSSTSRSIERCADAYLRVYREACDSI